MTKKIFFIMLIALFALHTDDAKGAEGSSQIKKLKISQVVNGSAALGLGGTGLATTFCIKKAVEFANNFFADAGLTGRFGMILIGGPVFIGLLGLNTTLYSNAGFYAYQAFSDHKKLKAENRRAKLT